MEDSKCLHYSQKYHEQGYAFAHLAANTFGQLGQEFLRFLWIRLIMLPATIFLSRSQFCPFLPGMRLLRSRTLLRLFFLNIS